jgi:beta-lactamase regulating signal transducer with metallopeptidase domain/tetratricopeptide (TPR) repeat protein
MSGYVLQEMFGIVGGNTLLERLAIASIEVAVLAGLLWALCRMRVVKSPRLCALLWLVVLAKPLISLIAGSPMPVVAIESPVKTEVLTAWNGGGNLDEVIAAQLARDMAQLEQLPSARVEVPEFEAPAAGVAATVAETVQVPASAGRSEQWSLAAALALLWALGVLAMATVILVDVIKLQLLRRRGTEAPEALREMAHTIGRDIGLKAMPRLRVIAGLDSPALVGTVRPTVFVPCWMADEANAEQSAWLLRHELMHARHGDSLALLLRRAAEALFFFHPVVWFAGRQWEEATELACDRALVASNDQARDYARQLLGVLETRHVQRPMVMSPGLFATRTQIGRRIAALLANPLQHPARLSVAALAIVLVGGVATVSMGLGINKEEPAVEQERTQAMGIAEEGDPVEWIEPESRRLLSDALVKSNVSRAQADLRAMNVALEAYRVDFGVFPESKWQLTTPIAYMSWIPEDPFAAYALQQKDRNTGQVKPAPADKTYQMAYAPDFTEFRIYSIGPDGRDDGGQVAYDPAKGHLSGGDIVRSLQLEDYYVFEGDMLKTFVANPDEDGAPKSMTGLVRGQQSRLEAGAQAVRLWAIRNKKLPESWKEISDTEEGFVPPVDLFAVDSKVVRYVLRDNVAYVYSVGPNQQDDGGDRIPNGRYTQKSMPTGDLVETVTWEEVRKLVDRMENPTAAIEEDEYLKQMLAQREKSGQDNAMIHYQLAMLTWPGLPSGDLDSEMNRLRQPGEVWTAETNMLLPYLHGWEASFAKIREGVALDQAENVDPGIDGPATKVPNFLFAQQSARALVAQGKYFESKGDYDKALDNYVTAVRMGRDYGSRNALLIGSLISIAMQNIGNNAISQLVTSGKLSEPQLARAGAELAHVAETYLGTTEGFRGEQKAGEAGIEQRKSELREMSDEEFARRRSEFQRNIGMSGLASFLIGSREGMIKWLDDGAKELSEFYEVVAEEVAKPPYEQRPDALFQDEVVSRMKHPMAKIALPNFMEASTRDYVMQAKRDILRIQIALERYRNFNGHYPDILKVVEGRWIDELPVDPFSGKPFIYHPFDNATKYVLFSVGPDGVENDEPIPYDPRNGTISPGEIF